MKLRPLQDKVLVKRTDEEQTTPGGIVLPGSAAEKPSQGEVVAVGPGKRDENGVIAPIGVEVGDLVIFGQYEAPEIMVDMACGKLNQLSRSQCERVRGFVAQVIEDGQQFFRLSAGGSKHDRLVTVVDKPRIVIKRTVTMNSIRSDANDVGIDGSCVFYGNMLEAAIDVIPN